MSENETPPETVAALGGEPPPKTSAVRKVCSALRAELAARVPLPDKARQAPATAVSTELPGLCRITAQWCWLVRGRNPGTYGVLYKAYRLDGQPMTQTVGAQVFASKVSHLLRQYARRAAETAA